MQRWHQALRPAVWRRMMSSNANHCNREGAPLAAIKKQALPFDRVGDAKEKHHELLMWNI
jgi:hypothetical protein